MSNKTKTIWKNVVVLPNSGKKSWSGGAYTLAYVYSNKGNFLVKGYKKEVEIYLKSLKEKGYKYFVNLSLRHTPNWEVKTNHRDIWYFWNNDYYISEPSMTIFNKPKWNKWEFGKWAENKPLYTFKRFPNRWIPEIFENLEK